MMVAKRAVLHPGPAAVKSFGEALIKARRVPIEIPGMNPPVVGRPRERGELPSAWEGEEFPSVRRNHSYVFELHDGPLFITIDLHSNVKHWRLFVLSDRLGRNALGEMVFSLNLTLADRGEDEITLRQRLRLSTRDMQSEGRLGAANDLASRLRSFGLDVTSDRDITFPTFKVQAGKFAGVSASAFIRDLIVVGVLKGHYMGNKDYKLRGLEPAPLRGSLPSRVVRVLADEEDEAEKDGAFNPKDKRDARRRTMAAIVCRRGQQKFRSKLLDAYERKCAVTGCDAVDALEAAHINPYLGDHTNYVTNGLLLRSDIHTLFDLRKITVNPETGKVLIAKELKNSMYREYEGRRIREPKDARCSPNKDALRKHRREAGL